MSPILRDGELANLRAAVDQTVSTTAAVLRKTKTSDNAGGAIETWATVASYPCSFAQFQVRSQEREDTARVQAISYWQFRFAYDADVRPEDRLQVGSRTFEVTGGGTASVAISLSLLAVEIT